MAKHPPKEPRSKRQERGVPRAKRRDVWLLRSMKYGGGREGEEREEKERRRTEGRTPSAALFREGGHTQPLYPSSRPPSSMCRNEKGYRKEPDTAFFPDRNLHDVVLAEQTAYCGHHPLIRYLEFHLIGASLPPSLTPFATKKRTYADTPHPFFSHGRRAEGGREPFPLLLFLSFRLLP